jgi:uncharacterized protein YdhG (YjbR/CyaY superfamily)
MRGMMKTVDGYIGAYPKDVRQILDRIRRTVKKAAPYAEESVSYGMPGYRLKGRPLVYFGAWKDHIGFYPTPSGAEAFKKELSKYKTAKGSVRFPLDEPMPYGLVERMVRYRAKENAEYARKRMG